MDAFLALLGDQAFRYTMRYGVPFTSKVVWQQFAKRLKTVDDKAIHADFKSLLEVLESKTNIITPALDLIEFKSTRGNVVLANAATLARSIRQDIEVLWKRVRNTAMIVGATRAPERHHAELLILIAEIKKLLDRIDRDAPLLQLAITASGEALSTSVPPGISPSRFLQASAFLMMGDTQFANDPSRPAQIGPPFTLSLYMLFLGHNHPVSGLKEKQDRKFATPTRSTGSTPREEIPYGLGEGDRKPIWKEVLHKCRVRLCRTPREWEFDPKYGYRQADAGARSSGQGLEDMLLSGFGRADEFTYYIEVVENLDDGRVHADTDSKTSFDDIPNAGIRESIPIYQISKLFYADTGRILNIGNDDSFESSPILLLKREENAPKPSTAMGEPISPVDRDSTRSTSSDEQGAIDRQLSGESEVPSRKGCMKSVDRQQKWKLPPDLDPEWIALEVFTEDEEDSNSEEEDGLSDGKSDDDGEVQILIKKTRRVQRSSLDSKLIAQIRNLSLRPCSLPENQNDTRPSSSDTMASQPTTPEMLMARSPFGNIASSLSLLEMLIRLTGLQEFQQAQHLSIPDHILAFFLEETSTTGLRGTERWKVRNEAKRRVGFDPYADTPTK